MPNSVVVGAQWGDEGKAKVVDYLAERSDLIIRYQGGANAGHTVVAQGEKFIFHMVPSGIMYPTKTCVLANGVVFDSEQFLSEIDELAERNVRTDGRLFVSDQTHLVLPFHKAMDLACEATTKGEKIGTTGRGIGPAYADKASRTGIRMCELIDWDHFTERLSDAFAQKQYLVENLYKRTFDLDLEQIIEQYRDIRERMLPFVTDTGTLIYNNFRQGRSLLFEGAQGTFLDVDHGTYPFVTSSNTVAGAACVGAGLGPSAIDHVIGIVKSYTTRVGNGPFPTELTDSTGDLLQEKGKEFGATTGRPRRCGWFDSVMLRKAVQLNAFTRIALTKIDVLKDLDEVKICTHYRIGGRDVDRFPSSAAQLADVEPVYETLPGWREDLSKCRDFSELPENAVRFVRRVQELCSNVATLMISVGPDRAQTIEVEPL